MEKVNTAEGVIRKLERLEFNYFQDLILLIFFKANLINMNANK
jgi:hypothetical protein